MPNYTIVDYFGYPLSPQDRMKAIRRAGFDGVILLWTDYFDSDYRDFPKYAASEGLYVENTHAPYKYANAIWEDTPAGADYTEHILTCVRDCREFGIPTLVMHPINGTVPLPEDPALGLERFRRILDLAEKCGVSIAIENQGNPAYVGLVFRHVQSDSLRFCWDSGHENYYSPGLDLLSLYGDKLSALHLHDNDGTEDAHALPFSVEPHKGRVDWGKVTEKLTSISYTGAVALETLNQGYEHITDPVAFLRIALEMAKRIL